MPLTDEQKAAIETLKSVAADDIEEATEALKSSAHPIYQKVFNGGHTTGASAEKAKRTATEQQLASEKERATALETELTELKAKTPDRAQIDSQWQQKLDREKKAIQDQLDAATQKVARLTTDTTAEKVENAMLAAGFEARTAKLLAKDGAARIGYGEDGKPVLYEPGDGKIPVQIPTGQSAFQVLAEQEKKTAPPSWLTSNADGGGGTGGGGGGKAVTVDDIRKSTEGTVNYSI